MKLYLEAELLHLLRRSHQHAGGESWSDNALISPVTRPIGLGAPPTGYGNVAGPVGSAPTLCDGVNATTRWCNCQD